MQPNYSGVRWRERASALLLACVIAGPVAAQVHVSTTGSDTGDGRNPAQPILTLAYALGQADPGEEIRIASGTYATSASADGSVLITGGWAADFASRPDADDPSATVLSGAMANRVLYLNASEAGTIWTLDGLTIGQGNASTSSSLPGLGGGICATGGGHLSLTNVILDANRARETADTTNNLAFGRGGGAYVQGTLSMESCTVKNNRGTRAFLTGGGNVGSAGGAGGGVYVQLNTGLVGETGPQVSISNTEFNNNIANTATSAGLGFGGVYSYGGGLAIELPTPAKSGRAVAQPLDIQLNGCNFVGNGAKTGDEAEAKGGGLYVSIGDPAVAGSVTIINSTITGNSASGTQQNLVTAGSGALGGGIYCAFPSTDDCELTVSNSMVSGNVGDALGGNSFGTGGGLAIEGGSLTVINSTFSNNRAAEKTQDGRGGAIDAINTKCRIINSTIKNNAALTEDTSFPLPFTSAYGGAIFIRTFDSKPIVIGNCVFFGNQTYVGTPKSSDVGQHLYLDSQGAEILFGNNTVVGGGPGGALATDGGQYDIQNNIFDSMDYAIKHGFATTGVYSYNLFGAEVVRDDGSGGLGIGPGNIGPNDPAFLDPKTADFHLTQTSPAINAGTPNPNFPNDIENNPRDENPDIGAYEFLISTGELADYGDAPAPYPTLLADDGARHLPPIAVTLQLGPSIDFENDGIPSADALGDDMNQSNDEGADAHDRVPLGCGLIGRPLNARPGVVNVVEIHPNGNGFINLWVDYNANGSWDDAGEHVVQNAAVTSATMQVSFVGPAVPVYAETFSRMRLSVDPLNSPKGAVTGGEVVDFRTRVTGSADLGVTIQPASGYIQTPVQNNQMITYTIRVTNNGGPTASAPAQIVLTRRGISTAGKNLVFSDFMTALTAQNVVPAGTTFSDLTGTWSIPSLAPNQSLDLVLVYQLNVTNPVIEPTVFGLKAKIDCYTSIDANVANNVVGIIHSYSFLRDRGGESMRKLLRRLRHRGDVDEFTVPPADYNGDGVLDVSDILLIFGLEAEIEIGDEQ